MDQDPEAIPFLSTAPASRRDRLWAIAVVALSFAGMAAILPFTNVQWPRLVAFVPAIDTGLALIYMITALLLIGQFAQVRRPSIIVLASGFMFACFVVIAHLLSYAQVLRELRPATANDQTTGWLYAAWHVLFPAFVLAYALAAGTNSDRPVAGSRVLPVIGAGIAAAIALAGASVSAVIGLTPELPALIKDGAYTALVTSGISPLICMISLLALATLYVRTRARRVLDLWLCVALFAWVLDMLLGFVTHAQYAFGWYATRVYGLLAASIVLGAMLVETGQLYARLTDAIERMRIQSAALFQSEAALRQAQKMEAIGQITGGIAHDFNNLLTVIIGSLEMLKRRAGTDAQIAKPVGYALEAAVRGEQLTKQLLAFSRRQVLHPQTIVVDRLIRDFQGLLGRAVGGGVRVVLELAAEGALIRVDPAQFEAAMLNLAVNARDAMAGAGAITIASRTLKADPASRDLLPGRYVAVSVADTGEGMSEQTIAQAFEPFFTTKPVGQGSGLGLSQVYGFVKSAGGHVTLNSTKGSGTTVQLFLPLADPERDAKAEGEVAETRSQSGRGEKILIVEDDPAVLDMAAESLRELGYVVEQATDAQAALRTLDGNPGIDLMLSDIMMPGGMNGIELARIVRARMPGIKIILTTGYAASLDVQAPPPEGVEILAKPYRQEELAQCLRTMLDADR